MKLLNILSPPPPSLSSSLSHLFICPGSIRAADLPSGGASASCRQWSVTGQTVSVRWYVPLTAGRFPHEKIFEFFFDQDEPINTKLISRSCSALWRISLTQGQLAWHHRCSTATADWSDSSETSANIHLSTRPSSLHTAQHSLLLQYYQVTNMSNAPPSCFSATPDLLTRLLKSLASFLLSYLTHIPPRSIQSRSYWPTLSRNIKIDFFFF